MFAHTTRALVLVMLLVAGAWPRPVRAEDPAARTIAVLDIQGTGVDPALLPTLSEILTVEVDMLGMYRVIGGRDIQAMLGFEQQKEVLGCTDATCLAEIGGALGVERILASHIGKVGDTFVVNIKLINIRIATTEARVYETVNGKQDLLIATVRTSVQKLLGPGSKAATSLRATPESGPKVKEDPPPFADSSSSADAGPRKSSTVAPSEQKSRAVGTAPELGETQTEVVAEDEPLYKKWWLWTIVGVVAAGAVVGGVAAGVAASNNSNHHSGQSSLTISGTIPTP